MSPCTVQVDIWSVLAEVIEQAWVLWEMLILAQPLMVLAPSPGKQPCLPASNLDACMQECSVLPA